MKGGTVQIAWHGSEPVLSLDFHSPSSLLATAGADHDIKLWSVLRKDNAAPTVKFEANLSHHTLAVNTVRFSPSGQLLASGGDGGEILIWRPAESVDNTFSWKVLKTLRLHSKDVLDLAWSPDGASLISGSVDNSCIIWDISTGSPQQILTDHLHYVQGVAWDPAGHFLASLSADRTCRIYSRVAPTHGKQKKGSNKKSFICEYVLAKTDITPLKTNAQMDSSDSPGKAAAVKHHLFHDETLPSFFRRLAWSPDASFLVVPSGIIPVILDLLDSTVAERMRGRDGQTSGPAIQLPGPSKPVVAVRFCPVVFTLKSDIVQKEVTCTENPGFRLPYRLVFAVATLNSIFVYDTQHSCPIVIFAGLHYAAITDIAWSADARYVAMSSQDGYCTILAFDDGELGVPMPCKDLPPHMAGYLPEALLAKANDAATGTSIKPKPGNHTRPEEISYISVHPRPLKHRRITPATISADPPPLKASSSELAVPSSTKCENDVDMSGVELHTVVGLNLESSELDDCEDNIVTDGDYKEN